MRKAMKLAKIEVESENTVNTPFINWLLKSIFSFEAILLERVRFPFGVSIICIGEKI